MGYLEKYHKANPLRAGMSKEELKSKLPAFARSKLFHMMMNQMTKDEEVVQEENMVRLMSHKVSLGVDQADIREKILHTYLHAGLTPPYFKELGQNLDIGNARAKDVLMLLVDEGKIIKVKEDLYFDTNAVNDLKNRMTEFLLAHGEMTTPQFKDLAGVSRKYLIPLIEYFDSKQVTIRIGDIRKLRKG